MDIKQEIISAQETLKAAGVTIGGFCKTVDIHPSTWREWRNGSLPQLGKWLRVRAALDALEKRA